MKMRYFLVMLLVCCWVGSIWGQELQTLQSQHRSLLTKEGITALATRNLGSAEHNGNLFSVAVEGQQVSLLTDQHGKVYHLYAVRLGTQTLLVVRAIGGTNDSVVVATIEKSGMQLTIKIDGIKTTEGFGVDNLLSLGLSFAQPTCECEWWQGLLSFSAEEYESRSYYATRDAAVANVPTHVSPKYCFVWKDGSASLPWRPIPGTGCAHWVAHQKGIQESPGCYDRYAIRVSQVTAGRTSHSLSNAHVGDIWTNTDSSHCGIVIGLGSGQVKVRHCSSGSGGVVESWFSSGYAWR